MIGLMSVSDYGRKIGYPVYITKGVQGYYIETEGGRCLEYHSDRKTCERLVTEAGYTKKGRGFYTKD